MNTEVSVSDTEEISDAFIIFREENDTIIDISLLRIFSLKGIMNDFSEFPLRIILSILYKFSL